MCLPATGCMAMTRPVPVLEPGRGKTKTGRLWTYVRDGRPCADEAPPAVCYFYSSDRKAEHPRATLRASTASFMPMAMRLSRNSTRPGRRGGDRDPGSGLHGPCPAQVLRPDHDPAPVAEEALWRIGELYDIERNIRGSPPEQRLAVRRKRTRPRFDGAAKMAGRDLDRAAAQIRHAEVIRYALARWQALGRFIDDGTIEIDNNAAERSIRPIAIGRKNWLFAGSDKGGERAAAHPVADRDREAERHRSRSLSPQRPRKDRRPSDQQDRRTPAVEGFSEPSNCLTGCFQNEQFPLSSVCRKCLAAVDDNIHSGNLSGTLATRANRGGLMRIRHIGGAVFGLILICVFAYLISDYLPSDRPFRNGKEIADLLIADARKA